MQLEGKHLWTARSTDAWLLWAGIEDDSIDGSDSVLDCDDNDGGGVGGGGGGSGGDKFNRKAVLGTARLL